MLSLKDFYYKQLLSEATLSGPELTKKDSYIQNFLKQIESEESLITNSKESVVLDKTDPDVQRLISALKTNNPEKILEVVGEKKAKSISYYKIFSCTDGRTIALNELSKDSVKDSTDQKKDAASTQMQENASMMCFKYALENNGKFPDVNDVAKIYPDVLNLKNGWMLSFQAQTKVAYEKLEGLRFEEFNRDGSFMNWISKKVASFGIKKKDTWNPADIWLLKQKWGPGSKLYDALNSAESIVAVNAILKAALVNHDIVGISLKKTDKVAHWKVYNDDDYLAALKDYVIEYQSGILDLSMSKDFFKNKEFSFNCEGKIKGQVKGNSDGSIALEFSIIGAKALLGKASRSFVDLLLKEHGFSIPNKHTVPSTIEEFTEELPKYKKYIEVIIESGIADTKVSAIEFQKNVHTILGQATKQTLFDLSCKFQAIQFAYYLAVIKEMSKDSFQTFITEIVLAAEKAGEKFGPYVKIY